MATSVFLLRRWMYTHRLRTFRAPVTALYIKIPFLRDFFLHLIEQGTTECCASFRALRFLGSFPVSFSKHGSTRTLPLPEERKVALVAVDLLQPHRHRPRAVQSPYANTSTFTDTNKYNRIINQSTTLGASLAQLCKMASRAAPLSTRS